MSELILPGVFIEVRDEGLLVPGGVTVGNLGVVGTAAKGPIGEPIVLGSPTEARQHFGDPDPWIDGTSDELTLVRALELAFQHGGGTTFAVRVASAAAASASYTLSSAGGNNVTLTAQSPGSWANQLEVNVALAEENGFVLDQIHNGAAAIVLPNVVPSARNRVRLFRDADGVTRSLPIVYDDPPAAGQVQIDLATGNLAFFAGEQPAASDVTTISYAVASAHAVKVTLRLGTAKEVYTVVSGQDLAADVNADSAWVTGEADAANGAELPAQSTALDAFAAFGTGGNARGDDGAIDADYQGGLDALLDEPAHLIVAAGQDERFGATLTAHCEIASTDEVQRERIAVVGARPGASFDDLRGHSLAGDRLIFAAPGFVAIDRDGPSQRTAFPAALTAAAVAGRLSGISAHISLTNKTLALGELETSFTRPQLKQLLQARVLVLESRDGTRVTKGITTSTNTAFHQITTRRIVDFAKFGVRSASRPFIGRLNNERVRGALRTTINSFLTQMVDDEMLVSYELAVSATRDQEIRGIVAVEMTLLPTFSIDFIKVTMTLG
jgi:hypothetical protein